MKIAVADEEFGVLSVQMVVSECFFVNMAVAEEQFRLLSAKQRYIVFCKGLILGEEVLNSGSFVEQVNLR